MTAKQNPKNEQLTEQNLAEFIPTVDKKSRMTIFRPWLMSSDQATFTQGEAVPAFESSMARRVGSSFGGSDQQRHISPPHRLPRSRAGPR